MLSPALPYVRIVDADEPLSIDNQTLPFSDLLSRAQEQAEDGDDELLLNMPALAAGQSVNIGGGAWALWTLTPTDQPSEPGDIQQ
jgi:hypothetical protein